MLLGILWFALGRNWAASHKRPAILLVARRASPLCSGLRLVAPELAVSVDGAVLNSLAALLRGAQGLAVLEATFEVFHQAEPRPRVVMRVVSAAGANPELLLRVLTLGSS